MRKERIITEPYRTTLVENDGQIVEIKISAVDGTALDTAVISQALRALIDSLRRDEVHARMAERRASTSDALVEMRRAFKAGGGRITDDYLARLAVAYSEGSGTGRSVIPDLAEAIGTPPSTLKGHIVRARREGWLSESGMGRKGGDPTEKSRDLIAKLTD